MARRRKKNNFADKWKEVIEFFKTTGKKSVPVILVFVIVAILCVGLKNYIMSIDYFKVRSIFIVNTNGSERDVNFLKTAKEIHNVKGMNIFKVNINWLEGQLSNKYPQIKKLVVKRVMPDRIEFVVEQRVPVAVIDAFGLYAIDEQSTVLVFDDHVMEKLPMIKGFKIWKKPIIGQKMQLERIELAKDILTMLNNVQAIKDHGIKSIDVSNPNNIILQIDGPVEIRMGSKDMSKKIKKLEFILEDDNIDIKGLKYIDLRFEDPVLGPKK